MHFHILADTTDQIPQIDQQDPRTANKRKAVYLQPIVGWIFGGMLGWLFGYLFKIRGGSFSFVCWMLLVRCEAGWVCAVEYFWTEQCNARKWLSNCRNRKNAEKLTFNDRFSYSREKTFERYGGRLYVFAMYVRNVYIIRREIWWNAIIYWKHSCRRRLHVENAA